MKDCSFLKGNLFSRRGLFDNKRIYENTLSSYNRAIKNKFGIELDVRLLKDGTVVCFHDEDMKRLLHLEGKIDKMTYDELSYVARYQIPTLEEALNEINGSVPILIQIVDPSHKHQLENKLVEILDNYKGDFAIESFHIRPLKWFYKNKPEYVTGFMIGWKNFKRDFFFKKYDFINIKIKLYSIKKIKQYKNDKIVIAWRILDKTELEDNKYIYDNLVCDNLLDIIEN